MTNKYTRIILGILISMFWLLPVQAQESENEGIATVVLITPKDGHEDALIKGITDYHHWVANFEGHMRYNWYEVLTGPNTGKYIARSGNHNWADFDAEYEWQEEAGEVFQRNVAPHIASAERTMTEEMKDFSHWPESFDGYTHFAVQDWYVKTGQFGKFRRGLKQIVDTLKAANWPNYWGFFSVESGGYGGQITLVTANKGWSDMTEVDPSFFDVMSEALGGPEEFDNFMSDWGSTFKTGGNQMVKFMPDASDYGDE